MSALTAFAVLGSAVWLFGWSDRFHAVVGVPAAALISLAGLAVMRRRRAALLADPDAIFEDSRSGILVKLLIGFAAGAILVLALSGTFRLAAASPLYPVLVDTEGQQIIAEVEILERLGEWTAVSQRLADVPATISAGTRKRLAQKNVDALIHLGEATPDLAPACGLFRRAEQEATEQGLDTRLAKSRLDWCAARATRRPMPAGTRAEIIAIERLAPRSLRVSVRVADERDRPIAGLIAEDFTVKADGQPVDVSAAAPEPRTARPGHRLSIVLDHSGDERQQAILTASYLAAGLTSGDSTEIVVCGAAARVAVPRTDDSFVALRSLFTLQAAQPCALRDALWLALERLGTGPRRAVVVMSNGTDVGSTHPFSEVAGRVKATGTPVFVLPLGPGAEELRALAGASGGGVYDPARQDQRESLRARFRGVQGSSPLTYVLMVADVAVARGRLDVIVGGEHAASASTSF